jgi:hypothetical protein
MQLRLQQYEIDICILGALGGYVGGKPADAVEPDGERMYLSVAEIYRSRRE